MGRGPYLPNLDPIIQAGIDPKTGLPIRMGTPNETLKEDIKRQLRIMDEQNAVRRFKWYNLPNGLTGDLVERMLYYKGQLAFFFMPADEKFYILPYALDGTIDVYGRFTAITPLQFNGQPGSTTDKGKIKPWITGLKRTVLYDFPDDMNLKDFEEGCVILKDYTPQMSETIIPRQILQESVLDAMSEAFPMARTNLISNSGIKGMRVQDEDSQAQVKLASRSITHAAMTGDPWVPIVGQMEFQDLTSAGSALKSEEYLLYLQALDNYRLSLYGLGNGGLFQKKSHMLESEQQMNSGNVGLIMEDGLALRQGFCDLVNSIWGIGIACEIAEPVLGVDRNMDGMIGDNQDQSGTMPGEQPQEVQE